MCLINYGPESGKLCTIIDIVDGNRALVDGPVSLTGVSRQTINFKSLSLTKIKVGITRNARLAQLEKVFKKEDVLAKWAETSTAKRLARRMKRANMNDFDRFKLMVARKTKSALVKKSLKKLKKSA